MLYWLILWAIETTLDPTDFKCYGWKKKKKLRHFASFHFLSLYGKERPGYSSCVLLRIWRTVKGILFKNSLFVFFGRKKIIAVLNDTRVSKWWQKCHFWVNYPFKIICIFTYPPSPSYGSFIRFWPPSSRHFALYKQFCAVFSKGCIFYIPSSLIVDSQFFPSLNTMRLPSVFATEAWCCQLLVGPKAVWWHK